MELGSFDGTQYVKNSNTFVATQTNDEKTMPDLLNTLSLAKECLCKIRTCTCTEMCIGFGDWCHLDHAKS